MQRIFDGHNDVLLRLWKKAHAGDDPVAAFVGGSERAHVDLPRAQAPAAWSAAFRPSTSPRASSR